MELLPKMNGKINTHIQNNAEFTSGIECFGPCQSNFGPCQSNFGSGSKQCISLCGVRVGPSGFMVLEYRALTGSPAELS